MVSGEKNRRAQVTIFIILALVIVVLVLGYFIFKNVAKKEAIPESILPIQSSLLSCLKEDASTGITLLESKGGYINLPSFEPGSRYMPFSSQLTFVGREIPYWDYVSGANIERTQIPTKEEMELQLANYIDSRIKYCNFNSYLSEGFDIVSGNPQTKVTINDGSVEINLLMDLNIMKGGNSFSIKTSNLKINSNLGKLYSAAKKVYGLEKNDSFLENYSIDVLRLYAPVDGVDVTCSPKKWNIIDVLNKFETALEINTMALKNIGNKNNYFVVKGLPKDVKINFLTSKNWPRYFEANPVDGNFLIANPIGNQPGLGILGFCYVAYHFVYNVRYPVLVQISEGNEIFQFPLAVLIEGNLPRKAKKDAVIMSGENLCKNENTKTTINVYSENLNILNNASISYNCLSSSCNLGKTINGTLNALLPQCVNGQLIVKANGYKTSITSYTSLNNGSTTVLLNKQYPHRVYILIDGKNYTGEAIINFVEGNSSKTLLYPEQDEISLNEGNYKIKVSAYAKSNLSIGQTTKTQCINVPRSGVGAILGLQKKQCFQVNVPEQLVSTALIGGGSNQDYFLGEDLKKTNELILKIKNLGNPNSLESLQKNYLLLDISKLGVELK